MKDYQPVRKLEVLRCLSDGSQVLVGTLVQNATAVFFQYHPDYLAHSSSLSPFKLPFDAKLHQAPAEPHQQLHGLFADSLPDGWGMLLMDRVFRQRGLLPQQISAMDRLAYIGDRGMGALSYRPVMDAVTDAAEDWIAIEALGKEAQAVFEGDTQTVLAALAQAGGSGGARPKAQIYLDVSAGNSVASPLASTQARAGLQPWLVKFTSRHLPLGHEESLCEAAYLTLAKNAGLEVPEWQLISANADANRWLAVRRFDCSERGRYHMHSLCGLVDAPFRQPSVDYVDLIKITQTLCKSVAAGQQLFARALFNLVGLNQDDHSKNWAFLMDDKGAWQLSPCFDLTFSPNANNEHMTAFNGYGKAPPLAAMQQLAKAANFSSWEDAKKMIEKMLDAFSDWQSVASDLGVQKQTRDLIGKQLSEQQQRCRSLYGLK